MGGWLRSDRAQGTVEYVAVVLLVAALAAAALAVAGSEPPGARLARALAGKLLCAVEGGGRCGEQASRQPALVAAYGGELAGVLARLAPEIGFERGEFSSLPVDFRHCRSRACADTSVAGAVRRSHAGAEPTAFTHVVDCRGPAPAPDADCSGSGAGNLYLQYWLYYPDSATRPFGRAGYHADDWESYQVRIAADGSRSARASSHRGHNGGGTGLGNLISDLGHSRSPRWGDRLDHLHVAGGSHAGAPVYEPDDARRVPRRALRLVPLEPILAEVEGSDFAVTPPWRKRVWSDPEATGTG